RERVVLDNLADSGAADPTDWIVIDDALGKLAVEDSTAAELIRLKVFAGLSVDEAADVLGVSRATAYRDWAFARAWLRNAVGIGSAEKKSAFP
ncbi:MAG TPA: ECF-type sigma factor, partial [Gemmataceae bacterium]|nr:ECF-type sigma factor [Gemmataceae bacterium]